MNNVLEDFCVLQLRLGCEGSQFLLVTFCISQPLHLLHLYIYSGIVIVANLFYYSTHKAQFCD